MDNCVTIPINGKVRNRSNGDQGIPGVSVSVWLRFTPFVNFFGSGDDKYVNEMVTNEAGDFIMNGVFNEYEFDIYRLEVSIPNDTNYLIPQLEFSLWNYPNQTHLTGLNFDYYDKTKFAINLHRTNTDTFESYHFRYKFADSKWYNTSSINGINPPSEVVIVDVTAANTPTTVVGIKTFPGDIEQTDTFQVYSTHTYFDTLDMNY